MLKSQKIQKSLNFLKVLLFLIILTSNPNLISANLYHIRADMYDEITTKTEYVFIMLFKHNSQKSEDASWQFEYSSDKVKKRGIVFGIIEKVDENSEIIKNIGYEEYPKVILLYRGFPIPFEYSVLEENVDAFVNMKINKEIIKFKNFEEVEKFRKRKESVIFIGEENYQDQNYLSFLKVSKAFDDKIFGQCTSQDCMEHFDSFKGIVSIYNGFNDKMSNIDRYNTQQLMSFVKENTSNIFPELTKEAADTIFNKYSAGVFLFYDKEEPKQEKFIIPFTSVAKHLKYSIHIVIADYQSEMGRQVVEILKLKKEDCPKVFIIDSRKEDIQLYKLTKEITEENILNFVIEWGLNKLKPLVFSEEIPERQTFPLMTLVGKNYNELVINSEFDFVVYYMKPNCGPCKIFEKKLRRIANVIYKEFGENLNLRFGMINGEVNDIEKVSILNYPAVNCYLKGNKLKPVKYEINDFEIDKLVKFIVENVKYLNYDKIMDLLEKNAESLNILENEEEGNRENIKGNVQVNVEGNANVDVNYVKDDM